MKCPHTEYVIGLELLTKQNGRLRRLRHRCEWHDELHADEALLAIRARLVNQSFGKTCIPAAELTALEQFRKDVWVKWFSGDTAALRRMLGPELVAISAGAPHWQSLSQTIASSEKFSASGGKFVSVAFDSATTHRFGETVVMFSHYTVVTENAGKRSTQKGRATEVFVRANSRWVHTSWHLDREP